MSLKKSAFRKKVENADRNARWIITFGGYAIIVNIIAILLFLIYQSLPLSFGATIEKWLSIPSVENNQNILLTGIDPYLEVFYEIDENGIVRFYNIESKQNIKTSSLPLFENEKLLSSAKGSGLKELFSVGSDSGRIITANIEMRAVYTDSGRSIIPSLEIQEELQVSAVHDTVPNHIEKTGFTENEDGSRLWVWVDHTNALHLRVYDADMEEEYFYNLSDDINKEEVTALSLSQNAENLVISTSSKNVFWFDLSDLEEPIVKDRFLTDAIVTDVKYLLGDQAIVLAGENGSVSTWFPIRTPANLFKFRKVHDFESHAASVTQIWVSARNRNFLTVDKKGNAKLHYSTTGQTEVEFKAAEFPIKTGTFSPKSNAIFVLDSQNQFGLFKLENQHPETNLETLFSPVWYEGYSDAQFVWQSTGGSDEFEPKLSLIPLIFGTLKGTLFAMIFSIPLALLAAIYVSRFAPRNLARQIKPVVEIMAALPSVVIGFLAGLYFSPFFEKYLMVIILFVILLPLFFLVTMFFIQRIPDGIRSKMPAGVEILFTIPIGIITYLFAMTFSQGFENLLFDGNFQQWVYQVLNVTYETRNSIVVGFALGFAVIPIIFTVSEDALSNVPESLTSASLALGASPWQTVRRVVLPAASGGIFAAIMLGLGRAVGETMIVLMATGNTPILDLNPFNGFRAMSACIAVEIPEAPVGGTLYRVLFFTGLLLFIFTFVLNTLSSLIGDKLRKKYARF
ncbi:MAG: ABC transporter permease subunit [Calditrichaeota bacterium]|nr:MAG: ABC transporter permease subunit [Calditrichota bacterium]MBL1207826.1 ABC transporter permease subunit [Calditrichota bacterium]NOG47660.1 ABC transporter permease subunit [Calditrichota bacterium]